MTLKEKYNKKEKENNQMLKTNFEVYYVLLNKFYNKLIAYYLK